MKQLFANLCSKLDALSNYHFAPRPIADEAEVRAVTTPAIAMEEVLPLHVSDARGVAPEEVYATKRGREGILRGETEMDQVRRRVVCKIHGFSKMILTILFLVCVDGTKTTAHVQEGCPSQDSQGKVVRRQTHFQTGTWSWIKQSVRKAQDARRTPNRPGSRKGYRWRTGWDRLLWIQQHLFQAITNRSARGDSRKDRWALRAKEKWTQIKVKFFQVVISISYLIWFVTDV